MHSEAQTKEMGAYSRTKKVARLTFAVFSAFASYGHRLESLPNKASSMVSFDAHAKLSLAR